MEEEKGMLLIEFKMDRIQLGPNIDAYEISAISAIAQCGTEESQNLEDIKGKLLTLKWT